MAGRRKVIATNLARLETAGHLPGADRMAVARRVPCGIGFGHSFHAQELQRYYSSLGPAKSGSPWNASGPRPGAAPGAYLMVIEIAAEVVELPATSVTTAVSMCVAFVTLDVFQVREYGLVVSVASFVVPSR